jgi:hypothetical protein
MTVLLMVEQRTHEWVQQVYNYTMRDLYTDPEYWNAHGNPKKMAALSATDLAHGRSQVNKRRRKSRHSVDGTDGLVRLEVQLLLAAKDQINNSWMTARKAVLNTLSGLLTSPTDDDTATLLGVQVGEIAWDTARSAFPYAGRTKVADRSNHKPRMHPSQVQFVQDDWRLFDARQGDQIRWTTTDEGPVASPRVWLAGDAAARKKDNVVGPLYTWIIIKVRVMGVCALRSVTKNAWRRSDIRSV